MIGWLVLLFRKPSGSGTGGRVRTVTGGPRPTRSVTAGPRPARTVTGSS